MKKWIEKYNMQYKEIRQGQESFFARYKPAGIPASIITSVSQEKRLWDAGSTAHPS
jgi:hypothetical protein